ncbi:MAG: hypothetical protein J7L66_04445, partial [Anaerolineaceae bacterium]|nr:hypothetical protein [Anaerolineaceae bacterium]
MMIMQPDYITKNLFTKMVEIVKKKKDSLELNNVKLASYHEGLCMQIFHQGPYGEKERATIDKLHTYIESEGY